MTISADGRSVQDTAAIGYQGAITVTPSDTTVLAAGRAVAVICTVAGNVAFQFMDGSSLTVPVTTGYNQFAFSVNKIKSTGTTATATYALLT